MFSAGTRGTVIAEIKALSVTAELSYIFYCSYAYVAPVDINSKAALEAAGAQAGLRFEVRDRDCGLDEPTVYTAGDYAMMYVNLLLCLVRYTS